METVFGEYALPCVCAFWACVGFTLMFNIHGLGKLIAGVGGALPLVPGGGVYYAMRHGVAGETDAFLSTLLHTFGMAAALAVGAMLASSAFRAVFPRLRPPKQ